MHLICFHLEVFYLTAGKAAGPNVELPMKGSKRITEKPVWTLETPKQLSCHLPLLSADLVNGGGDLGEGGGVLEEAPIKQNWLTYKKKFKKEEKKKGLVVRQLTDSQKCPLCSGALPSVLFIFILSFIHSFLLFIWALFHHFEDSIALLSVIGAG